MTASKATIVTISSSVSAGPVGNTVIVPTLLALGVEAVAIPTVILSNHPGHGRPEGLEIPANIIGVMLRRTVELGFARQPSLILTGYFADAAQIETVATFIAAEKKANPTGYYLCDPVLGDEHTGLYVKPKIAEAIRDILVPLADGMTPNAYELGWLTRLPVHDVHSARAAAAELPGRDVVVTSVPHGRDRLAIEAYRDGSRVSVVRPRLSLVPHGTGDLFAAVLAAGIAKGIRPDAGLGFAVAAVEQVIAKSAGSNALNLADGLRNLGDAVACEAVSDD
jgi:pyridoxine kinase